MVRDGAVLLSQWWRLNISIGQWHTVRVLESGTVIMEVKDGGDEPIGPEDIMD